MCCSTPGVGVLFCSVLFLYRLTVTGFYRLPVTGSRSSGLPPSIGGLFCFLARKVLGLLV